MAAATSTSAFTADVRLFHGWTPLVPERQAVVRKDPDHTVVPIATTSEYIWVLPAAQGLLASISQFPIMIRQEYDDLLLAILSSLDRQQQELRDDQAGVPLIPPPKEEADDSRMDVDGQAVPPRIKEESVEPAALQLRIAQRRISDLETYPNPFQLPEYRGLYNAAGTIIVTGLPGIGKTCFIRLLFHLRVAAGLPTLYVSNDRSATLYKNGQLGQLKFPSTIELMVNLPKETWCLVDSNVHFPTVPGEVQDTRLFIVQASSPRAHRIQYAKKIDGRSQFCLMSPWTLSELIAGYSLQPLAHTPEQNIKAFYERFGGSARNVFGRFNDSDAFEAEIDAVAATLSAEDIERVFLSHVTELTVPDHVGHMLLSAFPVTDDDRRQFQIRSPSTAMYAKVLKRLHASDNKARLRLYRICVGVKTAGCRAWAADLFDQHFHDFLSIGGTWPLHAIEQSAGTRMGAARRRWTGRTEESGSFLRADKEMSIVTTGEQPQQSATVSRVTFDEANEPGVGSPLSPGVYYRPTRKNFATFDSFYIDNPGHALAFQASRAQEHDVKEEGLKWLEDRGITKITYIYVTPANSEGCPNLKVPVARENMFDFFYHMRL